MEFLERERGILERYLPGLDQALTAIPFMAREHTDSQVLRLFRAAGGPALLIPTEYAGLGASPPEAIAIQRAIASRSPSLAIATTMHHFSAASLIEIAALGTGLEGILLEGVARQQLLMASGFAEGQVGRSILAPTMQARRTEGGFLVNGRKKPCSLTWSMDLLTASIALVDDEPGQPTFGVMIIPAKSAGIERQKFWGSWLLAGAESDEVILHDVFVPEKMVVPVDNNNGADTVQNTGFLWFELLISASYLGIASALVERVIQAQRGEPVDRALLGIEVESAMAALEGVAYAMSLGDRSADLLARMLFVRYSVERTIERASARAAELAGGMAFINAPEVSYLYAAARALAFHPPSRSSIAQTLVDYLGGAPIKMS